MKKSYKCIVSDQNVKILLAFVATNLVIFGILNHNIIMSLQWMQCWLKQCQSRILHWTSCFLSTLCSGRFLQIHHKDILPVKIIKIIILYYIVTYQFYMDTCAQSNTKAGGSNQNVLAIALISEGTTTVSLDFTTFKYFHQIL